MRARAQTLRFLDPRAARQLQALVRRPPPCTDPTLHRMLRRAELYSRYVDRRSAVGVANRPRPVDDTVSIALSRPPNGSRLSCGQTKRAARTRSERPQMPVRAQTLRFLDPRAARQLQALVRRLASRHLGRAGAMRLGRGALRVAPAPHDASDTGLGGWVPHYHHADIVAASRLTRFGQLSLLTGTMQLGRQPSAYRRLSAQYPP